MGVYTFAIEKKNGSSQTTNSIQSDLYSLSKRLLHTCSTRHPSIQKQAPASQAPAIQQQG